MLDDGELAPGELLETVLETKSPGRERAERPVRCHHIPRVDGCL